MTNIKKQIITQVLLITTVLTWLAFFTLNRLTPLVVDDLWYSFIYASDAKLISSLSDIPISVYNHYMQWGGRAVALIICQFFLYVGKSWFDIANSIIYILFIYLICFHATGKRISGKSGALLFFSVNVFLWYYVLAWGQDFLWLTGSCFYLWTTVIIFLFLIPYRQKHENPNYSLKLFGSILLFFGGILAGWCNENSGAAVLALLFFYFLWKIVKKEKIETWEILGAVGFLIGFVFLIAAPGNYVRARLYPTAPLHLEIVQRLPYVLWMFVRVTTYSFIILSILVGIELWFHQKKSINRFTLLYFLAGIASVFAMLLAPGYPDRVCLVSTVFWSLGVFNLLKQLEFGPVFRRCIPTCTVIALLFSSASLFSAGRHIFRMKQAFAERQHYILEEKAKGVTNIVVKGPILAPNRHMAIHGLEDVWEDPTFWLNVETAKYYGIKTIRRAPPTLDNAGATGNAQDK